MKNGKIVQVMGPVVDVEFPDNIMPLIEVKARRIGGATYHI